MKKTDLAIISFLFLSLLLFNNTVYAGGGQCLGATGGSGSSERIDDIFPSLISRMRINQELHSYQFVDDPKSLFHMSAEDQAGVIKAKHEFEFETDEDNPQITARGKGSEYIASFESSNWSLSDLNRAEGSPHANQVIRSMFNEALETNGNLNHNPTRPRAIIQTTVNNPVTVEALKGNPIEIKDPVNPGQTVTRPVIDSTYDEYKDVIDLTDSAGTPNTTNKKVLNAYLAHTPNGKLTARLLDDLGLEADGIHLRYNPETQVLEDNFDIAVSTVPKETNGLVYPADGEIGQVQLIDGTTTYARKIGNTWWEVNPETGAQIGASLSEDKGVFVRIQGQGGAPQGVVYGGSHVLPDYTIREVVLNTGERTRMARNYFGEWREINQSGDDIGRLYAPGEDGGSPSRTHFARPGELHKVPLSGDYYSKPPVERGALTTEDAVRIKSFIFDNSAPGGSSCTGQSLRVAEFLETGDESFLTRPMEPGEMQTVTIKNMQYKIAQKFPGKFSKLVTPPGRRLTLNDVAGRLAQDRPGSYAFISTVNQDASTGHVFLMVNDGSTPRIIHVNNTGAGAFEVFYNWNGMYAPSESPIYIYTGPNEQFFINESFCVVVGWYRGA